MFIVAPHLPVLPGDFVLALLISPCLNFGATDRAAPVGAIVGGAVGGVLAVSGLILMTLFKTGRIKAKKRDRSPPSHAAAASGPAGNVEYPSVAQHPIIPDNQYPAVHRYPEAT